MVDHKHPELTRFIVLLLGDESWQTGNTEELRIQKQFATRMLTLADKEELDLEQTYKRVLRGLKAMV